MPVRFFVDENDLALGRALADEHGNVGALDDEWLPIIGAKGLVVITRDRRIRYRPAEKLAWVRHGVRGFVLTGKKSQTIVPRTP